MIWPVSPLKRIWKAQALENRERKSSPSGVIDPLPVQEGELEILLSGYSPSR